MMMTGTMGETDRWMAERQGTGEQEDITDRKAGALVPHSNETERVERTHHPA